MADSRAQAHRRVAEAEHGVERRMKKIAGKVPDEQGFTHAADELSRRADRHLAKAEEIDDRAERN